MCLQQNGCHRVTTKQKKTLQKVTNNKTKTTKATHTHTQSVQDRRKSVAKGIVVNVTWPCGLALDLCQVLAFQQFFPFRFLPFKFLPFKFLCLYPVYVLVGRKNTQEHARTRNQNTSAGSHISAKRVYRVRSCILHIETRHDDIILHHASKTSYSASRP